MNKRDFNGTWTRLAGAVFRGRETLRRIAAITLADEAQPAERLREICRLAEVRSEDFTWVLKAPASNRRPERKRNALAERIQHSTTT